MKKENLKEMKLFLVISDDDEYEYDIECLENIIIAKSEERALEIAEENGYEDVSVRLITDSLNKEFCSRELRDYVRIKNDEYEVKTNIGLSDSIDEELINKSKEEVLESMKRWIDIYKPLNEVLKDLKDAWTEFENLNKPKKTDEEYEDYLDSMDSKKPNKIEELQKNLDIVNSKSDNFYYYIKNNELFELDKKTENVGCWCSLSYMVKSYFLEDEDSEEEKLTDILMLEFKDRDGDICICPVNGAYC